MKRHVGIISALIFTIIVLSCSFAVADFWEDLAKGVVKGLQDKAKEDEKEKKIKEDNEKINNLLKKLPTSARVAVLKPRIIAPEVDQLEDEDTQKRANKLLGHNSEPWKDILEGGLINLGITVLDRDAFKDIEKEIVYSQTGEVDPSSSAKFGKAVGATHLLDIKITYGAGVIRTRHITGTLSLKITEVESMKIVGKTNITFDFDVDQPEESTAPTQQTKKSMPSEPLTLLAPTGFSVDPGSYKTYSWDFREGGTLNIGISADFDVSVLVTDETNYRIFDSGGTAKLLAKKKITSGSFSVSIPRGSHYLIIYNKDSLLTPVSVGMSVYFTPEQ